jgi:hypothetical protein
LVDAFPVPFVSCNAVAAGADDGSDADSDDGSDADSDDGNAGVDADYDQLTGCHNKKDDHREDDHELAPFFKKFKL